MTQRDRHTPESGAPAAPARNAPASGVPVCAWEDLYPSFPPDRRQELLELAARQGLLYAHQLPPRNGASTSGADAVRLALLPALLNGQIKDLLPLRPAPVECRDAALDASQRDAVARAVQTPDLCLVQGRPGAGKSRTAAEIIVQAVARGDRVLLLAPSAAAVDGVLERLDGRDGVCAARVLAGSEKSDSLPPGLRRLVFEEQLRAFREEAAPAAKQAAEEAANRCGNRRRDESIWTDLEEIARRREARIEESRRLVEEIGRLDEQVEADAAAGEGPAPFQRELAAHRQTRDEARARIDAQLAALRAEAAKVRSEQQTAVADLERLQPLAEARRNRRWWTIAWWRARGESDLVHRIEELDKRQRELKAAAEQLAGELEEQAAERGRVEAQWQEETADVRRYEAGRRRAEREGRRAALSRELDALEEQGRRTSGGLSAGVAPPHELSIAAVQERREAERSTLAQEERQAQRAAQWAEAVQKTLAVLPQQLAEWINVVGATTTALPGDSRFGDHVSPRATFDLLVLKEAHLVTESEFLAAARRACRWVLIGEPTDEDPPPSSARGGRGYAARPARPNTLRPGFFQRLWRSLHSDPTCLPYAWFHRDGRLVCRLRSLDATADEHKWVASEHLADRPEIELRIAAPPRTAPRLLEVMFPGATAIHEAKAFIFRELGELPVQARGGCFHWHEDPRQLTLDVSDGADSQSPAVDLAEGVRERIGEAAPAGEGGVAWHTCALEFDREAGWTRERAEQWIEEHLPTQSLGRTVLLNAPHRSRPALARFLSGMLFDGRFLPRTGDDGPAVAFVPVPSLDAESMRHSPLAREGEGGGNRRGGMATAVPRLRSTRGGAGLEIDLADPRRHDPLPSDLRAALPRLGLVNLFEARAVVRKLETLAADPAFRAAAEEWANREIGCALASCRTSRTPCVGRRPALAVMALYPAQTELIRLLAARSAPLAAAPVSLEFGTPDAFRQRECFTALVSLTRSHSHRAVPFGGDPALLSTALTRAAFRLILFGDPGTLARRCQWNGAVEHLDETSAERERGRIAQLVAYLHGDGLHPSTFGLEESGRV